MLFFEEANSKIHKVEDQWHYPILTEFGWDPETKESVGFVRAYLYKHPNKDFMVKCVTGASADYWECVGGLGGGHWKELRPWLEANA